MNIDFKTVVTIGVMQPLKVDQLVHLKIHEDPEHIDKIRQALRAHMSGQFLKTLEDQNYLLEAFEAEFDKRWNKMMTRVATLI